MEIKTMAKKRKPWPNTLASKTLAMYVSLKFNVSPGVLMFRNPPMGAMPFFNNSASPEIRAAELGMVAGEMVKHFIELQIPFEGSGTANKAHDDLVASMLSEKAPSSDMVAAVDKNFRFKDEP
jgi:hypothetical protein